MNARFCQEVVQLNCYKWFPLLDKLSEQRENLSEKRSQANFYSEEGNFIISAWKLELRSQV